MSVNDYDIELHEAVEDLVESGWLDEGGAPFGIAQQAVQLGCESLSDIQRLAYERVVERALAKRHSELETIHRDLNSSL